MIDNETKQKLLQELEKIGNVYYACAKVGIDKSTYYRWLKKDSKFKKQSRRAIQLGRNNLVDIAEHALLLNVKDKKMDAIKYVLSHNSSRYRKNVESKVVLEHIVKKPLKEVKDPLEGTLAGLLKAEHEESLKMQNSELGVDPNTFTGQSDSP